MRIAVIGSGGREHAILWKLARHPAVRKLYAIPGNGGTLAVAENIQATVSNVQQLREILVQLRPDLVVVGPEIPLVKGLADLLSASGISCFGPTAAAARIESSKAFAKDLMKRLEIPTAEYFLFEDFHELSRFVASTPEGNGWVVKADGLAAGKGVIVCRGVAEVMNAARSMLVEGAFGAAGKKVVLERRLAGKEASVLFWCDGIRAASMPPAKDYKCAFDGDLGPNTGGMGSYCPANHVTRDLSIKVNRDIVGPVLKAMANDGCPYKGILYVGLMITDQGPQVIEFNCRMGDPETQVILPSWPGDILDSMHAVIDGRINLVESSTETSTFSVCVVLAAEGYPNNHQTGIPLLPVGDSEESFLFHAGTEIAEGSTRSTGGRVLNAVGTGKSLQEARERAYELAHKALVPGLRMRMDIGQEVYSG